MWALDLAAEVASDQGITKRQFSDVTIRQALLRLGSGWKWAKARRTCGKRVPGPFSRRMASHPDWAVGFQDEVWWSRLARPEVHAWSGPEPMRLHQVEPGKPDTEARALACYGLLRADTGAMMLRFVRGRPASSVTENFLAWVCDRLATQDKRARLLVRDIASWHISGRVRAWIKAHNPRAKADGGVRIISCPLPVKAPWLNRIEPKWVHNKRAIIEPERKSTGDEVIERVCRYYGRERIERLSHYAF